MPTPCPQGERVSRARSRLLLDAPWFGALSLRLQIESDAGHRAPMATNGTVLKYSPVLLPQFSEKEVETIVAHEVLHCLAPGTPVMTSRGLRPIECIAENDRVLSGQRAGFARVLRVEARAYDGEMLTITPAFAEPIRITPNHRVLAIERGAVLDSARFIPAGELDPTRHLLLFPLPDTRKNGVPRSIGRSRDTYAQRTITLDDELAELIGWFVADGHIARGSGKPTRYAGKSSRRIVGFTLGQNDDADRLVDIITRKLHRAPSVNEIKGVKARRIYVSAKTFANFLARHFYDGTDKTIPVWMLGQPESIVRAFVAGYASGDGYTRGDFTTTSSVSPGVSGMLPLLLLRLRYRPTLKTMAPSAGSYPNARPAKRIRWANRVEVAGNRGDTMVGQKWCIPIRRIERAHYSGMVHNIATSTGSYCLPFFAVHNCALVHPFRFNGREHLLWNCAADYVVNAILLENGFSPVKGWLHDPRFDGMAAEQVYAILYKERQEQQQQSGAGTGQGAGQPGDGPQDLDPAPKPTSQDSQQTGSKPGTTPGALGGQDEAPGAKNDPQTSPDAGLTMTEADWEVATTQAAMVARKAGTMPAGAEWALKTAYEPIVDWRAVLRRFVEETMPADYSWTSPSRRYISQGIYLPGTVREGMPRLAVAVDTSGSIACDRMLLDKFAAEVQAVLHEARPELLTVLYCDAAVQGTEEFTPDDEVVLHAKGGGGTRFQPVFDAIAEWDEPPAALIYATDLCSSDRPVEPENYPVLWLTSPGTRDLGPFGETVRMETVEEGRKQEVA